MDPQLKQIFSEEKLNQFRSLLRNIERIALVCHARPDGDAIGSMAGLGLILESLGYRVVGIAPSGLPQPLTWTAGQHLIMEYDAEPQRVREALAAAQLLIHLDHNDITRTDPDLAADILATDAPRIMVDHHLFPKDDFALQFSYPDSSSTCEMVYELALRMWPVERISPEVASALYMGLMTDTGSFAHSCSRPRTFEVAAGLVAQGADIPMIRNYVLGAYREERLRLYGHALSSCMELLADGQAGLITLPRSILDGYGYQPGDTEGLVNEPLTIAGVNMSVMLTERNPKSVRVSLRSRSGVEVNRLAQEHFNGGGHAQASGGMLRMELGEAVEYTKARIAEFFAG